MDFDSECLMQNPMQTLKQQGIAFKSNADPDTMYWHQAMNEPDWDKFRAAADKELNDHFENKHWGLRKRSTLPKNTKVLPTVWSMKRKRRILTGEVYKYKAWINVHGDKQEEGIHYWETHSPVVTWMAIRIMLVLCLVHGWHS